jgi:hypothetical protein
MTFKFPERLVRVVRTSVAPPSVALEDLKQPEEKAHLTWPDFPELEEYKVQGLDSKGDPLIWDEECSSEKMTELLRSRSPGGGYLTVIGGQFAIFDPMTSNYVALCSSSRECPPRRVITRTGQRQHERFQASYFVDPAKTSPLKTRPMPRPYAWKTCWVSPNGQALFDIRELCRFLNENAGAIGDPYAWKLEEKKPDPVLNIFGPMGMVPNQHEPKTFLILGEET